MPDYKLVRTGRKTLAIYIRPNGEVEVRAPRRVSIQVIERALREREDWILQKQRALRSQYEKRQDFILTEGSTLTLLGKEYPVIFGEAPGFDGACFTVPVGDFVQVRSLIIQLYKKLAQEFLPERVRLYAGRTGLFPGSVRISSAVSRWGSCSGKNTLSFSWRLMMAPPAAVDYVVVHELAHIKEHNHSSQFWSLVESILPDYTEREKLLKDLQRKLSLENWDVRSLQQ